MQADQPCSTESTAADPLEISFRPLTGDDEFEVTVRGPLDSSTIGGLGECVDELIGRGCSCLIIDLDGVTFADASSLGLLIRTRRRMGASRGVVRVRYRGSPSLVRLMQITKLDRHFA